MNKDNFTIGVHRHPHPHLLTHLLLLLSSPNFHFGPRACATIFLRHPFPFFPQLGSILDIFNAVPSSMTLVDLLRVRSSTGQRVDTTKRMVRRLVKSVEATTDFLDAGKCIVFLLERLADCVDAASPAAAPLRKLRGVMDKHLGGEATVHLWLSGREGSKALQLHADEYDFLLIQLNGTKQWEICVPAPVIPSTPAAEDAGGWWNDARQAGSHDLFIFSTIYNDAIREVSVSKCTARPPPTMHHECAMSTATPRTLGG